jgi:hypothetical protein
MFLCEIGPFADSRLMAFTDLCVMAAQEAIKEQFSVPWLAKKPAEASAPPGDTASSSSSSPPSSKPAKATIGITVAPEPSQPTTPEPVAAPAVPATTEAASSSASAQDRPAEEPVAVLEGGAAEIPSQKPEAAAAQPASSNTVAGETQSPSGEVAESEPPTPRPEQVLAPPAVSGPKPRVLTQAHFAYALKNSSSSGSEELGALPELRKWNEQFGDAGTKKNKRSGFGKGFGFAEREPKKP